MKIKYCKKNNSFKYLNGELIEGKLKIERKKQHIRNDAFFKNGYRPDSNNGDSVMRALSDYTHKNVMKVYDYNFKNILVEYVDGKMVCDPALMDWKGWGNNRSSSQIVERYKSLYDGIDFWFPTTSLPHDFGEQLKAGLDHLHKIGVYHGDLKTNNLMITKDKVVKIIDFNSSIKAKEDEVDYSLDHHMFNRIVTGLNLNKELLYQDLVFRNR